jgi:hypothetical protein
LKFLQDYFAAGVEELAGEGFGEVLSILGEAGDLAADEALSLDVGYEGINCNTIGINSCEGARGRVTAALHSGQYLPFGKSNDADAGFIQGGNQVLRGSIITSGLDGEGTLGGGGEKFVRVEAEGDFVGQAEALEASAGENNGIIFSFFELSYAGGDIAADVGGSEVGS